MKMTVKKPIKMFKFLEDNPGSTGSHSVTMIEATVRSGRYRVVHAPNPHGFGNDWLIIHDTNIGASKAWLKQQPEVEIRGELYSVILLATAFFRRKMERWLTGAE